MHNPKSTTLLYLTISNRTITKSHSHAYTKPSQNIYLTIAKQRLLFAKLGKNLGISKWEDWYNISRDEVNNHFKDIYGFTNVRVILM